MEKRPGAALLAIKQQRSPRHIDLQQISAIYPNPSPPLQLILICDDALRGTGNGSFASGAVIPVPKPDCGWLPYLRPPPQR